MPKPQPKKATKKPAPKAKASKPAPKAAAKPKAAPKAKLAAKSTAATAAKPDTVGQRPKPGPKKPVKMTPFLLMQKQRLMALRDSILDSMAGVAKDTLRSRPEGSEASAFGMHQADAGSDAYDKDFALSLLSQEQDALYEIEEALKRVENGTYGTCEMSGKPIPHPRLEALPFARFTVQCQTEIEKTRRFQRSRVPVTSLFGLTENEGESDGEADEPEETPTKPQEE
jgi:RNA polymerase-binding transcription factor DksA